MPASTLTPANLVLDSLRISHWCTPWKLREPWVIKVSMFSWCNMDLPTSVGVLLNLGLQSALVRLLSGLRPQRRTIHETEIVHCSLQSIAFPTEDIVGMCAVSGTVAHAEHKWLTAIFRPICRVIEQPGIPRYFVEYLRDFHWMGGWTWAPGFEGSA